MTGLERSHLLITSEDGAGGSIDAAEIEWIARTKILLEQP
jgi:hypothetical protein